MKTLRVTYQKHEDMGYFGFIPENAPETFFPLTGMGVAHDLIEHDDTDLGSLHAEMKAFGVTAWARGQGGYWRNQMYNIAPLNAYHEICIFFHEWFTEAKPHWFEPCSQNRIRRARRRVNQDGREIAKATVSLTKNHSLSRQWAPGFADWLSQHTKQINNWLLIGWASAETRFRKLTPDRVVISYREIEEKIDRMLKGYDHPLGEPMEGDTAVLTWCDSTAEWSAEWDLPEYDFED